MALFDTIISGGTVVNSCATFTADVGIRDGKIAALGTDLGEAKQTINAAGKYVMLSLIHI